MTEQVILVNGDDDATGVMEKLQAHRQGLLHRAFSVFIFNSSGNVLLQQRQQGKYHSPLKWSNTCCGHPRPGENILAAAQRRLTEEMGLVCNLHYVFKFKYFAKVSGALAEHEIDHVFWGLTDDIPVINKEEAAAYKYITMDALAMELKAQPEKYTEWLNICFNRVYSLYKLFKL